MTPLSLGDLLLRIEELYRPAPLGHWRKRLERRSKEWLARPDLRLHWTAEDEAADGGAARLRLEGRSHPPCWLILDHPLEPDRTVLAEELARHVSAAVSVLESRAGDVPPRWRVRLTDRQIQAAVLAAQGLSNEDVASQLGVAPRTVARLLQDTYRRLEVSGRAALSAEMALLRPPTPFVPRRHGPE